MTQGQMAACFNEWMRRYIADPDGFAREFESVSDFLKDKQFGREPDYGGTCAAYMQKLLAEITAYQPARTDGRITRSQ